MKKNYLFILLFFFISLIVHSQYTTLELEEIRAESKEAGWSIHSLDFQESNSTYTTSTNRSMANIIPDAGMTQNFNVADGDFFYDPTDGTTGGPGGDCTTTSSGDPGDYPNCGCTTITTLTGTGLSVTFLSFNVFGTFDYLNIYDGPDTSSTQIYDSNVNATADTYAGMVALVGNPPVFTSTSGTLTFEFHATAVVNSCGWEAEISLAGPVCEVPDNVIIDDVTDTTVEISWDASADEMNGYDWVVMEDGDDPDVDTPVEDGNVQTGVTNVIVSGLSPNTEYDFYVKTLCDAGVESDWSTTLDFMTDQEDCEPPTNLMNDTVTQTTATFTWTLSASDADADGYVWGIFNEGDDPLTTTPLQESLEPSGVDNVEVTGLSPDTTYDFYMFTLCDGSSTPALISDIVGPERFTTTILGLGDNNLENFKFYPNPSADYIMLEANLPINMVEIFTISGKKVIEMESLSDSFQMDISSLNTGLYLIKVTIDNETGYFRLVKK